MSFSSLKINTFCLTCCCNNLAFYNDHHFHHGYHIYAAATVAYFDNDWGSKYFDDVLLYIRDIAK